MRILKAMAICLLINVSIAMATERPNILVFLADDHGWADSSVYGSPDAKTPSLQAMAKRGMVFDHAFVAFTFKNGNLLYHHVAPAARRC